MISFYQIFIATGTLGPQVEKRFAKNPTSDKGIGTSDAPPDEGAENNSEYKKKALLHWEVS